MKSPSVWRLSIVISLLATYAALAQNKTGLPAQGGPVIWEPPRVNISDDLPKATVPNPIITTLRIENLQIALEDTELSTAEKAIGAVVGHRGDASEYVAWVCVCGSDANGRWALWLESSELGGGVIDGFALQRIKSEVKPDSRCRALRGHENVLMGPRQFRLGQTKAEVLGTFGQPTTIIGHTMIFEHEYREVIHGEAYTTDNVVYITFGGGVTTSIQVWKDTTN